jgi:hypothetical protein
MNFFKFKLSYKKTSNYFDFQSKKKIFKKEPLGKKKC